MAQARIGGISSMSVSDAGVVAYSATETLGAEVHVLKPGTRQVRILGAGNAPAVDRGGRVAFARTDQSRRPLRDDVYVSDGSRAHKVATFPLVWSLFWHHGELAAMVGPGRTHLVWDVRNPSRRLALPGRGGLTIQVEPNHERVAAQMPNSDGSYDIGVASRTHRHFRRVADDLYPLAWSPSGRFLLASSLPPSTQLSVVDVQRHATTRVGGLPCGQAVQAAWLPRNTKLPAAPAG